MRFQMDLVFACRRLTCAISLASLIACGGPQFKAVEQAPEEVRPARPLASTTAPGATESQVQEPAPKASEVQWRTLRGLNLQTGSADPTLERLSGTSVKIAGYMVPFSDDLEKVSEFLLVPAAGLCIHKPAPPANQIIYVQVADGAARVDWDSAVMVTGAFQIDASDSPFGKASFRIAATRVDKW